MNGLSSFHKHINSCNDIWFANVYFGVRSTVESLFCTSDEWGMSGDKKMCDQNQMNTTAKKMMRWIQEKMTSKMLSPGAHIKPITKK